jgi:hypothetical protein
LVPLPCYSFAKVDSASFFFLPAPALRDVYYLEMFSENPDALTIKTRQDSTVMLTLIKKENI